MDLGFENKVVLVTGASGNIGGAICRAFLAENAIVAGTYRSNAEKIAVLAEWGSSNGISGEKLITFQADLNDSEAAQSLVTKVMDRFGRIDILVNAAGVTLENHFLLTGEEDWNRVWEINFNAIVRLTRVVLRPMVEARAGSIVNISSALGSRFGKGAVAYAASKAALDRFTQTMAFEVGKKGIRINAVCPGVIESEMASKMIRSMGENLLFKTPLEKLGRAEDIASAVLFLASENVSSFITGQKLFVDGGITL